MGRSGEDAARDISRRGNRFRSASDVRLLFEPRRARDLRSALRVRLPRAAVQDHSQHGCCNARHLGRRPGVEDPRAARHLLQRRSGVQGQEARARRRGLRLLDEAAARPESPGADAVVHRRQDRRQRRRDRQGEGDRSARLRRCDLGPEGARPVHAADHAEGARLHPPGVPHSNADGRRCARSHRNVRRCVGMGDGESGRHWRLPPPGVATRTEDRPRSESPLSRGVLPG